MVPETQNRTLIKMTQSILKEKQVPNYLYGEAVTHETYILNRISTRAMKEITPYELYYK